MSVSAAFEEIKKDFATTQVAHAQVIEAMTEFQAACVSGLWDRTEAARAKAHDNMDAFFDAYAAAHKVMGRIK